ncbi:TPA: DUF1669 domain-containing protein [Candidatus Woesearchaeota archaeon]|nr:DUF1669 domain-containing protein [Candidatus Woesearchaeota archaeon]
MKRGIIFVVLIILVGSVFLYFSPSFSLSSLPPTAASVVRTSIADQGNISLLFCPDDPCEEAVVNLLASAQESIYCALYDIGLESVQQTLFAQSEKIEVKIVTDDDYLHKFHHPFVRADRSGLMHNKFCIVDHKRMYTGSMNPTNNDAHKNNNNLFLIESTVVSDLYEQEFKELWNGTFKKGNLITTPSVTIDNTTLEIYFCPEDHCADHASEELFQAKRSIYFMTFSFTHERIAHALLLKHLDHLTIYGIMEKTQLSDYSKYDQLVHAGIPVLIDANKNNLHHKVFIIDEETVITGSFNPTAGGDQRNDENMLIIHDRNIAKLFIEEFWEEYALAEAQVASQ